jgi:hypothetical protein
MATRQTKRATKKTTKRRATKKTTNKRRATKKATKATKTTKRRATKRATKAAKTTKRRTTKRATKAAKATKRRTKVPTLPENYQSTSGREEPGPDGFAPSSFRRGRAVRSRKDTGLNASASRDDRARFGTSRGALNSRAAPSPGSARVSQVAQNRDH